MLRNNKNRNLWKFSTITIINEHNNFRIYSIIPLLCSNRTITSEGNVLLIFSQSKTAIFCGCLVGSQQNVEKILRTIYRSLLRITFSNLSVVSEKMLPYFRYMLNDILDVGLKQIIAQKVLQCQFFNYSVKWTTFFANKRCNIFR